MKRKLSSEAGLTLVELLSAVVILVLLSMMMGTGVQMALSSYEGMVAQNEVELLLSTAVDVLTDELRYARDVTERTGGDAETNFKYTSDAYGHETYLKWDNSAGQLMAKSKESESAENPAGVKTYPDGYRVLSTGAYGNSDDYKEYKLVTGADETYIRYEDGVFTVKLTIEARDDTGKSIRAATPEMSINSLNP